MAKTPGELTVTLPLFTEVNGVRYDLGTFELPVGLTLTSNDGHTITITGDVNAEAVYDELREWFDGRLDRRL